MHTLILIALVILNNGAWLQAAERPLSAGELQQWFDDDSQLHSLENTINEGELQFLASPPPGKAYAAFGAVSMPENSCTVITHKHRCD